MPKKKATTKRKTTTAKRKTTTANKSPAKRSTSKTTANRGTSPSRSVRDPWTKTQVISFIADETELSKKDVAAVLEIHNDILVRHLKGPGTFSIPGVAKFVKQRKPARKARKGVNPFTGEEIMLKAKPAHNVVKARILKKLKDEVK